MVVVGLGKEEEEYREGEGEFVSIKGRERGFCSQMN